MDRTVPQTLGSFEVISIVGRGGMGEVYRARDTKLKREVAIKILPEEFSRDPDRIARFQREAEVLASLNHPNIAAIYDLSETAGSRFLVLEFVEGETLAERIGRGPIPIDDALSIAKSICEALEVAHEKGITHRDLKPANIKITPDGKVKVLDFGLAKAVENAPAATALSNSPTMLSMAATNVGMILGTAAYMSPEQAKGRPVDRRTDIFAFGCVLYEMLTGRPTFDGEDISEILGRVITTEPDWRRLPSATPPAIRKLLRRALTKDPRQRLDSIRDARLELEEPLPLGEAATAKPTRVRVAWFAAIFAMILALLLAIPAVRHLQETPPAEMRLDIATPPTTDPISLAISPDARTLVFVGTSGGQSRLWLRPLESVAAQPITGTEGATYPFWSPDSRAVGFFADNKLKRIDVHGGTPQTLANAPGARGGSWNKDGVIVFAPVGVDSLYRVSASGGEATPVTRIDAVQNNHRMPQFLPDGRHFLFYAQGGKGRGVYVGSLDSPDAQRLFDADAAAVFLTSGYVAFLRQGTLFAQRFDVRKNQLVGEPFAVAQQVAFDSVLTIAALSAAADVLVYRSGTAVGVGRLTWFDRSGKSLGTLGDPDLQALNPDLSPDGKHVAVDRGGATGKNDVWLVEASRGVLERLTSDASNNIAPIWSPDGNTIAFASTKTGIVYDLYQKPAGGAGVETLLIASAWPKWPVSWSPDGRFLLYREQNPKTNYDLWALPIGGDHKAFPVANTGAEEREGQFSSDSRWIAIQSNESGRSEIYVEPFPGPGRRVRVSTNGGAQARWRKDGKELFYIGLDGKLMAAPITLSSNGQTADVGESAALFATHLTLGPIPFIQRHQYAVSPDGQRFLMNVTTQEQTATPITLILNWHPGNH